ncbi:MAG: inverse autotransporter beta domain-containing protein [Rhodospirillales bacterium]
MPLPAELDTTPRIADESAEGKLAKGAAKALSQASQGKTTAAVLELGEQTIDYLLPGLGANLPEWAKHIEIEAGAYENNAPRWSVLGVFPLFETDDLQNTFFTQISQQRYRMLGVTRDVTNAGLGYRRLLFNNAVLVGVNGFYDYGWKYHHQRASAGAEVKWAGLDLSSNYYWRISGTHSAGDNSFEDVLDGHDVRLAAQVPFVPWARVQGRRYWWSVDQSSEDIKGWEVGFEADIHQNLRFEAGLVGDNYIEDDNNNEGYVRFAWTMDLQRPVAMSSEVLSKSPWLMRDMSEYRLDKVKRENRIIVERFSTGVVITRGN